VCVFFFFIKKHTFAFFFVNAIFFFFFIFSNCNFFKNTISNDSFFTIWFKITLFIYEIIVTNAPCFNYSANVTFISAYTFFLGLFGSVILISEILKIRFLKIVFLKMQFLKSHLLKSHRRLVKHVKKYFFINRVFG
jgi:hypothetical protein